MPAYNARATIRSAVASALGQTHRNIELLLVDDGSTDNTANIALESAARDPRLRVIKTPGGLGPADARNAGIDAATAPRWIAFLDSDDVWSERKLEFQLVEAHRTGAGLLFTSYWRISEAGTLAGRPVRVPKSLNAWQSYGNTAIATSTVLLDMNCTGRPKLDGTVGYDDYELWTRLLSQGSHSRGIDQPLMAYRVRKSSVSSQKISMSKNVWTVLRDRRRLGRFASAWCFASYSSRAIIKHRIHAPRMSTQLTLDTSVLRALALDDHPC